MKMRRARYWRRGASSPALSREQPPSAMAGGAVVSTTGVLWILTFVATVDPR